MTRRTVVLAIGAALVLAAGLVVAGCTNTNTTSTSGANPTGPCAGSGYGDVSGGTPIGSPRWNPPFLPTIFKKFYNIMSYSITGCLLNP